MSSPDLPKLLVVDDEEAILETMTYTFMDVYDVITTTDAGRALALLDERDPVAVVITDQRMPEMTGVELLRHVYARHPDTVRIILTGFADSENAIRAINDGHVYAYINKPWEPEELKQVVARAVQLWRLTVENRRLLADLESANSIMAAVMDHLDVGAVAIDPSGVIRALNRPASAYLGLEGELRGRQIEAVLEERGLGALCESISELADAQGGCFEDHDLPAGRGGHRVRVSVQTLVRPEGPPLGRVVLFKEISHEPLRRHFEKTMAAVSEQQGGLRDALEGALAELRELAERVKASGVTSASMGELAERVSRSQTAIQSWLDVDDAIATSEYPEAQMLLDRMRLASERWPRQYELPKRVLALADSVESYYESGENSRERVL